MKGIVLFVEGDGDSDAAPRLVKKILTEQQAWDAVRLDEHPFRVGRIEGLVKHEYHEWKRFLRASLKRRNVGGVLLVLDGDIEKIGADKFCAGEVAKAFATEATKVGGGTTFSVAVVFARQEFESWMIAAIDSLAGRLLPDGRAISATAKSPEGNVEDGPRDAKGWLSKYIEGGYKPTRDQAVLTDLLELNTLRARQLRSFRRFESAISELVEAIRSNSHIATP